jgi:hypothetical protein
LFRWGLFGELGKMEPFYFIFRGVWLKKIAAEPFPETIPSRFGTILLEKKSLNPSARFSRPTQAVKSSLPRWVPAPCRRCSLQTAPQLYAAAPSGARVAPRARALEAAIGRSRSPRRACSQSGRAPLHLSTRAACYALPGARPGPGLLQRRPAPLSCPRSGTASLSPEARRPAPSRAPCRSVAVRRLPAPSLPPEWVCLCPVLTNEVPNLDFMCASLITSGVFLCCSAQGEQELQWQLILPFC